MKKSMNLVGKAGFIGLILVLASVLGAYAGYLSYTGPNGSYAWTSTDKTFIECSNGNRYNATFAGLQAAIYSLNATGGWIKGTNDILTTSIPLLITSNIELYNVNLFLNNNGNKTLIKNYDQTTGNKNIYLHDIKLNGNGLNQPAWVRYNNPTDHPNGIYFYGVNNITIDNIIFNNITFCGVMLRKCNRIFISDSRFYDIGPGFLPTTPSASGYYAYFAAGVVLYNTTNSSIRNCLFNRVYACGIIVQNINDLNMRYADHDFIISDCIVNEAHIGYYFEEAREGIIQNSLAYNCSHNVTDQTINGFMISATTENIQITNCIATRCGSRYSTGSNFMLSGKNTSIYNSKSIKSRGYGIYVGSNSSTVSNCMSLNDSRTGIQVYGNNPNILGNTVKYAGLNGISVSAVNTALQLLNKNCIISNNIINRTGQYGIYCGLNNFTISGNSLDRTLGGAINIVRKFGTISNNLISWGANGGSYAIALSGSSLTNNITISSNIIFNSSGGIQLGSTCSNITVIGNRIRGCTTYSLYEYAGAKCNTFVANNVLQGGTMELHGTWGKVGFNQGFNMFSLPIYAPSSPVAGNMWLNSTTGFIMYYYGATATLAHIHVNAT